MTASATVISNGTGGAGTSGAGGAGTGGQAGGEAFKTPRHVWWNFVSSSRERIQEAKRA